MEMSIWHKMSACVCGECPFLCMLVNRLWSGAIPTSRTQRHPLSSPPTLIPSLTHTHILSHTHSLMHARTLSLSHTHALTQRGQYHRGGAVPGTREGTAARAHAQGHSRKGTLSKLVPTCMYVCMCVCMSRLGSFGITPFITPGVLVTPAVWV